MKICQRNHERPDNDTRCKECILFRDRARYQTKKKNYMKSRYLVTREKQIQYASNWNKQNPERKLKNQLSYQKRNPGKTQNITKKYKISKQLRTPKWLTKSDWIEIKWAHSEARKRTKETGIKYVVDHIIPLQGKNISGLHCPQNLQIITHKQNSRKGISIGKVG